MLRFQKYYVAKNERYQPRGKPRTLSSAASGGVLDPHGNKEMPQHLKIARGEARESKGRYWRMRFLLPLETVNKRRAVLDQIIGGLTTTINTLESKRTK